MDVEVNAVELAGAEGPGQGVPASTSEGASDGPHETESAQSAPSRTEPDVDSEASELLASLEGADDLPLDERLELLRRAETSIASALERLDGL